MTRRTWHKYKSRPNPFRLLLATHTLLGQEATNRRSALSSIQHVKKNKDPLLPESCLLLSTCATKNMPSLFLTTRRSPPARITLLSPPRGCLQLVASRSCFRVWASKGFVKMHFSRRNALIGGSGRRSTCYQSNHRAPAFGSRGRGGPKCQFVWAGRGVGCRSSTLYHLERIAASQAILACLGSARLLRHIPVRSEGGFGRRGADGLN